MSEMSRLVGLGNTVSVLVVEDGDVRRVKQIEAVMIPK